MQKQKNKGMKKSIILPMLAAAITAVGAVATQKSSVYADSFTIDDVMSEIQASVKTDYDVDLITNNRSYAAYKPDGFFAGVFLDGNSGKELKISPDSEVDGITRELIIQRYKDALISPSVFDFNNYNVYPDEYIHTRNGILCRIIGDSLSCTNIEGNYFAENKNTLNLLAAAYENSGFDASYLVFGVPPTNIDKQIKVSKYDGHSSLLMNVGISDGDSLVYGYRSAFYRTPADGNWIYAPEISGRALASCSAFDTEDLQKAFSGNTCYDEEADELSEVAFVEEVNDGG